MKDKIIRSLDFIVYWSIVLLPFSIAISSSPMNVFTGFIIVFSLIKKIIKKEPLFVKTSINAPLFLFLAIVCFSAFRSSYIQDTLKGGIFRLAQYVLLFFSVVSELRDKLHAKRIMCAIIAGLMLASVDSIWQVITGRDFIRGYAPVINIGIARATASFKDSNSLGIYLSALAPLVFGITLYCCQGLKNRLLFILVSFVALIGIVLTYSRPTLLAVFIALLFLGIARKNRLLVYLLLVLALLAPFLAPRPVKDWARQVEYNPLRFMCNDDRIAFYRNSVRMIKAHPWLGLGANTYMKNYKQYKEIPEYRNIVTPDYVYAHNNFLHMTAELGFVGLGVFLWLVYRLFKAARRIYRFLKDDYLEVLSLSLSACLAAFLINGLTESSLYYARVAVVFWYLTGLALALEKFVHENKS